MFYNDQLHFSCLKDIREDKQTVVVVEVCMQDH
jgi:hypothetical protein